MLSKTFNDVTCLLTDILLPSGFDITPDDNRCSTLHKITDYYNATGRVLVWSGASDKSIFGDPRVNHAFRAWHDYVHITRQLPFTQAGEHDVMLAQQRHVKALRLRPQAEQACLALLECEIDDQIQALIDTGAFIDDQVQFTINQLNRKGLSCLNLNSPLF